MRWFIAIWMLALVAALAVGQSWETQSWRGGSGGARPGVKVSAVVAEDGAWPILTVRTNPGFDHELRVKVRDGTPVVEDTPADRIRLVTVPEIAVDVDDTVSVAVVMIVGSDEITVHNEPVTVRRGGGAGIVVEPVLTGEGHTPYGTVSIELGYADSVDVYLRLVNDPEGTPDIVHGYDDGEVLSLSPALTMTGTWLLPDELPAETGDSLYVRLDFNLGFQIEYGFELAASVAPSNLLAVAGAGRVTLTWDASGQDVVGYQILRKLDGAAYFDTIAYYHETYAVPESHRVNPDGAFADFTYFYDPYHDRFHVFGIDKSVTWNDGGSTQESPAEARWVHTYSSDHRTWTQATDIKISDLAGEAGAIAEGDSTYYIDHIWAPHVILHDEEWHLFFTGVDRRAYGSEGGWGAAALSIQRIYHAKADLGDDLSDPSVWGNTRYVLNGDCTSCAGVTGSVIGTSGWAWGVSWRMACRDPFVVWDHDEEQWTMVLTINRNNSVQDAIGVATASDLDGAWTLLGGYGDNNDSSWPAYSSGKAESPSLVHLNDTWFLLFAREGSTTQYHSSNSPLGPFDFVFHPASGWGKWGLPGQATEPLTGTHTLGDGTTLRAWPQWTDRQAIMAASMTNPSTSGLVRFYTLQADTVAGDARLFRQHAVSDEINLLRTVGLDVTGTAYVDSSVATAAYDYAVMDVRSDGSRGGASAIEAVSAYYVVEPSSVTAFFGNLQPHFMSVVEIPMSGFNNAADPANYYTVTTESDWQARYRVILDADDEPGAAAWDTVSWGDPVDYHRYRSRLLYNSGSAGTLNKWSGIQWEMWTVGHSDNSTTHTRTALLLPDPVAPSWETPCYTIDGDDLTIHFSDNAEDQGTPYRTFTHYVIALLHKDTSYQYVPIDTVYAEEFDGLDPPRSYTHTDALVLFSGISGFDGAAYRVTAIGMQTSVDPPAAWSASVSDCFYVP